MFLLINETPFNIVSIYLTKHGTNNWNKAAYQTSQVSLSTTNTWELFDMKVVFNSPKNKKLQERTFVEGGFVYDVKRITLSAVTANKWQAHYEQ